MVSRSRLTVSFYVHCPSKFTFRSPGLCKLSVAVPSQTSYLQSTNNPPIHTLFISRPKSRQSPVCVLFLQIHVVTRRANVIYVYSQCWRIIFIGRKCQAAQWTRVSTRGIEEKSVRTLKGFVNFYCKRGKGLAILSPETSLYCDARSEKKSNYVIEDLPCCKSNLATPEHKSIT